MSKNIIEINIDDKIYRALSQTCTFCNQKFSELITTIYEFINPKNNKCENKEEKALRSLRYAFLVFYGYLLCVSKSKKLSREFDKEFIDFNASLGSIVALSCVFYDCKNILPILLGCLLMKFRSKLI